MLREMVNKFEPDSNYVNARELTLDEDLAGLDEAFKMRLANLEG